MGGSSVVPMGEECEDLRSSWRSAELAVAEEVRSVMCLAPVIRPEGSAPKGQENLAQGLPWVSQNRGLALKGLEMRTRSGSKVQSRFSPYLVAPSGLNTFFWLTQGKPWAKLSWPFGPQ
jgi:hypothetical protein